MKQSKFEEITDYDHKDTSDLINKNKSLKITDLGFELPEDLPTKVISIRLPTELLNRVKAYASQRDIAYTSVIKMIIARAAQKF